MTKSEEKARVEQVEHTYRVRAEQLERMHRAFLDTMDVWVARGYNTWYREPDYVSVMLNAVLAAAQAPSDLPDADTVTVGLVKTEAQDLRRRLACLTAWFEVTTPQVREEFVDALRQATDLLTRAVE